MSKNGDVLTPTEAAKLLMISPITLRQWAQKGKITSHSTLGGHRRFLYVDILEFAKRENITIHKEIVERKKPTILIVDDEVQFCILMKEVIDNVGGGFEVVFAHDGFDAGVKAHQLMPEIIFIDLFLPGINGDEVCQNIKFNPELKSIRIVGMTGQTTSENIVSFLNCGAESVLEKPIKQIKLLELINSL